MVELMLTLNDVNAIPDENVNDKREKNGNPRSMPLFFHASYVENHIAQNYP